MLLLTSNTTIFDAFTYDRNTYNVSSGTPLSPTFVTYGTTKYKRIQKLNTYSYTFVLYAAHNVAHSLHCSCATMDDHIFGPPAPPRPQPTTSTSWNNSTAKGLLQRDLATGTIPLSGHVMGSRAVYESRPEYAVYSFDLFTRRLATLRREAKSQNARRAADATALLRDRHLYPPPTHDEHGSLRWEGSAAETLLKADIANDLHKQMQPRELHQTRAEYQVFNADIFRGHIYQEVKRRKFMTSFYGR